MAYMRESEGKRAMLTADTANHNVWSLAHPDWQAGFDFDRGATSAARGSGDACRGQDGVSRLSHAVTFHRVHRDV
jgi:hypothetical protein